MFQNNPINYDGVDLGRNGFIVLNDEENHKKFLFDTKSNLFWQWSDISRRSVGDAGLALRDCGHDKIFHWHIPAFAQLSWLYAKIGEQAFIDLTDSRSFVFQSSGGPVIMKGSRCRLVTGYFGKFYIIGVSDFFRCVVDDKAHELLLKTAFENGWKLYSFKDNSPILKKKKTDSNSSPDSVIEKFRNLDYSSARLPKIDNSYFTDPNKGIWEFWNTDIPEKYHVRARNPVDDIRDWNVAIDFGTSSTVVAIDDNGQKKLLRIGVRDFYSEPKPKDYENPTILELISFRNTLAPWQSEAYRPAVSWDDVRCSHEALHNFRHNEADPKVVSSILAKIKQWALREASGERVRLTDQENGEEHLLAPLSLRQPVKGKPIEVSKDDPFDPLELYAWFLGLNINWRGRGIFLHYYMSFPVAYPKAVKEKMLASFRRGLQRSFPSTLIDQAELSDFTVEERATEPAAYAAAAMDQLNIEATESGVAYAVFDFGGGTADFEFGYYRLPTDKEAAEEYEQVFEHVGASGDKFLGGENLLENMAYHVFRDNLDICREKKIAFTRPLDAEDFPGSELFLDRTQAAYTNTIMLMAKLRPIWEAGTANNSSGIEKLALQDREGNKVSCEFAVHEQTLLEYLEARIEEGIQNFYVALHKYFGDKPDTVHVLLAGNASRSKWVSDFFGLILEGHEKADEEGDIRYNRIKDWYRALYQGDVPKIEPYGPLLEDPENIYSPTA